MTRSGMFQRNIVKAAKMPHWPAPPSLLQPNFALPLCKQQPPLPNIHPNIHQNNGKKSLFLAVFTVHEQTLITKSSLSKQRRDWLSPFAISSAAPSRTERYQLTKPSLSRSPSPASPKPSKSTQPIQSKSKMLSETRTSSQSTPSLRR